MLMLLLNSCSPLGNKQELKTIAERYFRGIYGCDSTVVYISLLITSQSAIQYSKKYLTNLQSRGHDAVKHFSSHFCSRWNEAKISFPGNCCRVKQGSFDMDFKARNVGALQPDVPPTGEVKSWGGISLIRFNKAGKIEAEIGEESEPGPIERIMQDH